MHLDVFPGEAPVLAAFPGAEKGFFAGMDSPVACQGTGAFEQAGATGMRAREGPVVRVCPVMACQAGAAVERTGASFERAHKRFFTAMLAQVDVQGHLAHEPFSTAVLWTGKGAFA